MKKFYSFLAICAIATFSFSCSKETPIPEENRPDNGQEQTDKPGEVNPDDKPVPEGMIRLTFTVSSEDTKTDWDGVHHTWTDGDQVRIIWGTGAADYANATVVNGSVSADVADAETYYAVYPADGAFALRDGGTIDFGIPRYQDGTFASANMMAARTSKEAASFAFKNLTHIIKFHTTATNPYNRFEFTSNENARVIANTYGVTFDSNQNVTIGAKTATIDGYNNTKYADLNTVTTNSDYYFAVGPETDFSSGFGVKARMSSEGDDYEYGALSKKAISTDRSRVTNLGDIDAMIHPDWFIKPGGTGNGSSWEDAGGLALFLNLIKFQTNDKGINSTWRLHNARIHFAEGTYDIYAANEGTLSFDDKAWDMEADSKYQLTNLNLTIDGGYPNSLTGTALTGKDPVNHPTKWQTAQTDDTFRVFEAKGCRMSGWTFDGITFEANGDHILPGDVLHFDGTTSGTITFNNCYFKDFVQTGTVNGGPVYIHGGVTAEINFTGCTFSGNQCNVGGAAYVYASNATVKFTDCTFTGNKASNGGSIRARGGNVNITNCTFTGLGIEDGDVNTAQQGGAVYVDGASVSISGGSVSNCKTANGGAIYYGSGSLTLQDGLEIFNCKTSSQGGAINVNGTDGTLNVNSCNIHNNMSGTTGGAIHLSGGTLNLTGGIIKENKATTTGGGLHVVDGEAIIMGTVFNGNESNAGSNGDSHGGAIYQAAGTVTIMDNESDHTYFIGNKAPGKRAGAILAKAAMSIDGAVFQQNVANNGAAIHLEAGANVTISNSYFSANPATNGGAIRTDGACTLTVDSCDITGNSASGGNGGGINVNGVATSIVVKNSSITDNTAKIGGGINITQTTANYVPVTIYNTAITGNTATGGAGGVYSRGKNDLIMVNCTVSGNTGTNAGGIYVTRQDNDTYKANITRLAMISCTVTGNTASDGTGGIYKETFGQVVDVYNSIISGNTGTSTNDDVRNDRLLYRVNKSIVVATSYTSADRVNNTGAGNFVWRKSVLSNPSAFDINTMLSSLSDGVHAATTVADNPAISCGMTSEELSGLTLRYTPTQTLDASFLTVDQKGNNRTGTVMGAYVGN